MITFDDPVWIQWVVALVFTLDAAQTGQHPQSSSLVSVFERGRDSGRDILGLGLHCYLLRCVNWAPVPNTQL